MTDMKTTTHPYPSTSARPLPSFRSVSLPPCCPFCGETTHAAEGYTTGAPCAPCQAKSDAYQARIGCAYNRADGHRCSACTDS